MDVIEAIRERKAVRAFKPDPVSLDMLKQIIEQALRAPSWANTQPWEFAIVTGKQLEEIKKGFLERESKNLYRRSPGLTSFPDPTFPGSRPWPQRVGRQPRKTWKFAG